MKKERVFRKRKAPVSISRIIALAFLALILIGTLLLNIPAASRNGRSAGFMKALFTATSATCVTGLVLADTWSQWSNFGQLIIICMIEIGGLGFMSAASMAFFMFRRKISLQQQMVMAEAIGATSMGDVIAMQKKLLKRSLALEAAGGLVLTAKFAGEYSLPLAVKLGFFHSISAFCNAGFDVLGFRGAGGSLYTYRTDPVICLTLAALIITGGLGFLVWDEVIRKKSLKKLSVYAKLVLITSAALIFGGMAVFCLVEWNNPDTIGRMNTWEKLLAAFFQSVTLRTAGFAAVDQGRLTAAGKAVSIFLMLIGGSSGSTAGGLKTVTFVVLLMFIWNRIRGRKTVSVFNRSIDNEHVMNAITIFMIMVLLSYTGAVVISSTSAVGLADALYETVSAIGTVGLTTGITPELSLPGKLLIIVFMYFGRVGVLTISFGFLRNSPAGQKFKYARTDLMIG